MKNHLIISLCMLLSLSTGTMRAWDGKTVADSYAGGDGTAENPYQIATCEQFAFFANNVRDIEGYSKGKYFLLTQDLVFNEQVYEGITRSTRQDKEDLPADISRYVETPCVGTYTSDAEYRAFEGTFDGGGHTISGMVGSLYRQQTYDALFRVLEGATVSNLGIYGSYLLSNARLGGLAGRVVDSRIINCHVEHSFIEGGGSQSGGFAGQLIGTSEVLNCYSDDVVVFGKNDMGGFIGRIGDSGENPCVVDNCYSRTELRIKRRNHGAVSFACCKGSVVRNVYYERLGEITTDFWTGYKDGQVENVSETSAEAFASAQLTESLNERASQIAGACRWKLEGGRIRHDYTTTTPSDGSGIRDLSLPPTPQTGTYSLDGRRVQPGTLRPGIYISNGRKIIITQ